MDISFYDNYTGANRDFDFFPVDGQYKLCGSMLAAICLRGKATIMVKLKEYVMERNTFMVIPADTPFYIKESSGDYHIDVMRIGEEFFDIVAGGTFRVNLDRLLNEKPLNTLSERKTRMFHIIHSYIKVLVHDESNRYRMQIVAGYLRVMFLEACNIITAPRMDTRNAKKEKVLTERFFQSVEKNFMTQRKVEFYAKELGITAKHLSLTLKKTTGRHPSDWIEEYTMLEAKKLLRNTNLTMQEISYDLDFATPSHFSRFFKNKTGKTPKEFRMSILPTEPPHEEVFSWE